MPVRKRKEVQEVLPKVNNSICPECGIAFHCGAKAGTNECWCFDETAARQRDPKAEDCLCKECLTKPVNTCLNVAVWIFILTFGIAFWMLVGYYVGKLF